MKKHLQCEYNNVESYFFLLFLFVLSLPSHTLKKKKKVASNVVTREQHEFKDKTGGHDDIMIIDNVITIYLGIFMYP